MTYTANSTVVIDTTRSFFSTSLVAEVPGTFLEIAQGATVSGYTSGGFISAFPTAPPSTINVIDKFPFATDANATDVGDLTRSRYAGAGHSSSVSGYTAGGYNSDPPPITPTNNTIDKFPFVTNANATDAGDLTQAISLTASQSSSVSGYTAGGSPSNINVIQRYPFSTDSNSSDVGDLTVGRRYGAGQSSSIHGYTAGGYYPNATPGGGPLGTFSVIDRFPFAVNANATDVGDLRGFIEQRDLSGQSSTTHGYATGTNNSTQIDKFPFATNSNSTLVGSLAQGAFRTAGQSSTVSGYATGGDIISPIKLNNIQKFPFATDSNATDIGDLTSPPRDQAAGQQY